MAKQNNNKEKLGYLDEHAEEGFENLDSTDFVVPFLRILQKLSPQVDPDAPEHVKGAKPGMFFNTVNNKLYGNVLELIPITFKKVWLEWLPERGGLVNRHKPYSIKVDTSHFTKWTVQGGVNIISECLLFYCLIIDHIEDGPIVFSLSSTGIKHGKNWNTQIMMTRLPSGKRAPYFSSVWELTVIKNENNQGVWYQIGSKKTAIERKRFISNKEFANFVFPFKQTLTEAQELDYSQVDEIPQQEQRVIETKQGDDEEEETPY